jgi:hypothetical protein
MYGGDQERSHQLYYQTIRRKADNQVKIQNSGARFELACEYHTDNFIYR